MFLLNRSIPNKALLNLGPIATKHVSRIQGPGNTLRAVHFQLEFADLPNKKQR